jgi:hypothetical protein
MKSGKKIRPQGPRKPYLELHEFFRILAEVVADKNPRETVDNGLVMYDNFTPITYYMMHVHPDVEFSDRRSICKYLNIRYVHWEDMCKMTKEFMVANSVSNPYYFT